MRKILAILCLLPVLASATTRNVVPRAAHEGKVGTASKPHAEHHADSIWAEQAYLDNITGTIDSATHSVNADSATYSDTADVVKVTVGYAGRYLPIWARPDSFRSDPWLSAITNTFLGFGVCGSGNLAGDGTNNTFYGFQTGYSNTEGGWNSAIGGGALYSNTEGDENTAVGYCALLSNIGGHENTAVGYRALYSNTTGTENSAMGSYALNANTTGEPNVAMGCHALRYNTTGSYNVAMGMLAGHYNVTGDSSIYVGNEAGFWDLLSCRFYLAHKRYADTTGARHHSLMYGVLGDSAQDQTLMLNAAVTSKHDFVCSTNTYADTSISHHRGLADSATLALTADSAAVAANAHTIQGKDTTWIKAQGGGGGDSNFIRAGIDTLGAYNDGQVYLDTDLKTDRWLSSDSNTFVGKGVCGAGNLAHGSGSEGWLNAFYGTLAGYSITSGEKNLAIGHQSLYSITSGDKSTAVGTRALYSSTASEETALGFEALYSSTTASGNTAVGYECMRNAASNNYYNTAVGYGALKAMVSLSSCALGYTALGQCTNGYNNAFGCQALNSMTSGQGQDAFGHRAGWHATTGNNNLFLGRECADAYTTGSNSIFVGPYAGYYETGSNKVFFDPFARSNEADGRVTAWIYGITAAATADQYIYLNSHLFVRETFTGTTTIRDSVKFDATQTTDTVVVSGGTTTDFYLLTWRGSTCATGPLSCTAGTDTVFVYCCEADTAKARSEGFTWFRVK